MLATLKHFPGHGDTEIDSHLGLPIIPHPRERLDAMELAPFRAGIAAGAGAVMVAHIELPALDPRTAPATFSRAVVTGLAAPRPGLRRPHRHRLDEDGRGRAHGAAGRGRGAAVQAGADVVLDSPDPVAAFTALKAAVASGQHRPRAARRVGAPRAAAPRRASACTARARCRSTAVPLAVGGRQHQAVARDDQRASADADQGRRRSRAAARCRAMPACCTCRCSTTRRTGASPRRAGR